MSFYSAIDLHSNNHVLVVIDDHDKVLCERRLDNDVALTLAALEPFRHELIGIAVESTPNWYWLVDGLMDHGHAVRLVNTAAVKQYDGLKHTDDEFDAFWLAHLLRLNILPTGYIYPRPLRHVRDLLRHRMELVQRRARLLNKLHGLHWRHHGVQLHRNQLMAKACEVHFDDANLQLAWDSCYRLLKSTHSEVKRVEKALAQQLEGRPDFARLMAIDGIGLITTLTVLLETGDIHRFKSAGHYASYCRCVRSERLSNGKKKGVGNDKCGNKYLSWAFSEGAHFLIRYAPKAKQYYERKKRKTSAQVAVRAIAHKLARAVFHVLRDGVAFEPDKAFS